MINVVQTPKAQSVARTDLLKINKGFRSGQNLGGKFALPAEFDASRFASSYVQKGPQVVAAMQDESILGTQYTAPGWQVWRFPGIPEKKISSSKKEKKNKTSGDAVISGREKAGLTHEVTSSTKDGITYVLMFRPIEVQNQVNRAYADLSLSQMVTEIRGDSLALPVEQSQGILTNRDLRQAGDRDIEADREFEENGGGRTAAIEPSLLPTGGGRARRRETAVHR